MSGYCENIPAAALFGDTNQASSIPNTALRDDGSHAKIKQARALLRSQLPDPRQRPTEQKASKHARRQAKPRGDGPAHRLSRTQLPDPAQSIPRASVGPVYLEGRLVLSLSFKLESPTGNKVPVPEGEKLLARYRIWDDNARNWLDCGLTALRFESADIVMRTQPQPAIVWSGVLDLQCPIIDVPDLDERGWAINQRHHLRWRTYMKR